jgi:fatty acid-binding protein DegV
MRTLVVTDSSGRPWPATASPAVVVVPITILLAARQVADDEIDPVQLDEALSRGDPVKTRAPSVMDYLDAVESTDAQAAVILTPAAELTAMWRHASHTPWLADRPVAVVDTRTAACGQALVVDAAADAAAAGNSLPDVVAAARDAAGRARVLGAVGTAEPLMAAGMVARARVAGEPGDPGEPGEAGEAGDDPGDDARGGRPAIFEARQGSIEPLRVLDGEDPVTALAELYAGERRAGSPIAFTGAGAGREVQAMAERLARLTDADHHPEVCSPAMTIYTGRDVIGIAWLDRD